MARRGDGLYLRSKTWRLDFRHEGTRHVVRLGKGISRSVAREIATVKRGEIIKGEAGIGRKRKDLLFEKAVELFLGWVETNRRPKTFSSYEQCAKELHKSFDSKRLSEIHSFLVEKHKQRRKEKAPVAANREINMLRTIFNHCIAAKKYEGTNPAKAKAKGKTGDGIERLRETKGRVRFLEHDEETRLLAQAREPLKTIILSGIYAGLRVQSEALTLTWENVDLKRKQLTVCAGYAKNGETRTVPLNTVLTEAFKRMSTVAKREHVFVKPDGSPYRSIRSAFETACKNANLNGVTPHTLRHTFASRLAMNGESLRTIQELGGWERIEMVQRYAHLSQNHKAEAVERIYLPPVFTPPEKQATSEVA